MMLQLLTIVTALVLGAECASVTTCRNSYDCGQGMCCRNADGTVLTDQQMGGFGPISLQPADHNGTCSTRPAQKGEVCDSSCDCDTGLKCYRPMSGVCCPPMTCYDEDYVKQQQAYWSNCLSNPHCALPP